MGVQSSIPIDTSTVLDGTAKNILTNSVGSLLDKTEVKISDNGLVEANERWPRVKRQWLLSWSSSGSDAAFVANLFEVNRQSRGFLYISPASTERAATGQAAKNTVTGLGTGDGSTTTFQLQVTASTSAHSVTRSIFYPLASTVTMYVDGVAKTPGSDFTFSTTTGIVTFTSAPAAGKAVTADLSFAWPVRFSSDTIQTTYLQVDQSELRSVPIEEVF